MADMCVILEGATPDAANLGVRFRAQIMPSRAVARGINDEHAVGLADMNAEIVEKTCGG